MLGKQIKKIRIDNNMTQEQFGEALSHTKSTISKWENNSSQPDIVTLKRISELFNIKLDTLVNDIPNVKKRRQQDVLLVEWAKTNYSGIQDLRVPKTWAIIKWLFAVLTLGSLLLTFSPILIAQDSFGKKELVLMLIGMILFVVFIIGLTVAASFTRRSSITKRFNVSTKIYKQKIVIRNKVSNKTKYILPSDITDVEKEKYKSEFQVTITLGNSSVITLFMVDASVYTKVRKIQEGGKND